MPPARSPPAPLRTLGAHSWRMTSRKPAAPVAKRKIWSPNIIVDLPHFRLPQASRRHDMKAASFSLSANERVGHAPQQAQRAVPRTQYDYSREISIQIKRDDVTSLLQRFEFRLIFIFFTATLLPPVTRICRRRPPSCRRAKNIDKPRARAERRSQ